MRLVDHVGVPSHPIDQRARSRAGFLGLWAVTFAVVTCTAGGRVESAASAPPMDPAPRPPSSSAAAGATARAHSAGESAPSGADTTPASPLDPFRQALRDLDDGKRKDSVRILWLGDSHTAADFWSHEVRASLAADHGDGGPGLVHAGLKVYRHGAAKITRGGSWSTRPKQPASWKPQGDGVFGLGGLRTIPREAKALLEVELRTERVACEPPVPGCWKDGSAKPTDVYRWEVVYRLPHPHSAFSVSIGNQSTRVDGKLEVVESARQSDLRSVVFSAPGTQTLKLAGAAGDPEIFGVYVDSEAPGVVVDTLGINGARIGTAASWNREHWVEEVRRRAPSLLVLAYGTNEVGDNHRVASYAAQFEEVLSRYREAVPNGACLLIGPTERALPDWTTNARVVEIDEMQRTVAGELGCEFFSAFENMGGEGSLRAWAYAQPPLARKDRVHLTPAGYRRLGRAIASTLRGQAQPGP